MVKYKTNNASGFTLIELVISTTILGVLIVAFAFPFSIWLEKKRLEQNAANLEQMAWAVSAFKNNQGYYPCPAAIDLSRDNANYGRQTDCTDTTTIPINTCSAVGSRICRALSDSSRVIENIDADEDGTLEVDVTPGQVGVLTAGQDDEFIPVVRIGGVPFRELNLPEEFAYDAYGNRIVYAVTENMARDTADNQPRTGGIDIVYEGGVSHLDNPFTANFVVLSHGEDGVGGINKFGVSNGDACNEASPDGQNCDHIDGAGLNAAFYSSNKVTTNDNNHHDDSLLYQMPLNTPLWARSKANPANIYSVPTESNPEGKVGSDYLYNFYASEPNPAQYSGGAFDPDYIDDLRDYQMVYEKSQLWVRGDLLVQQDPLAAPGTTGRVQAGLICDWEGENCFRATAIAGPTGTECEPANPGSFLRGVKRDPSATPTDVSDDVIVGDCSPIEFTCAGNRVLKSITNGVPDCVGRPCAAETRTSPCGEVFTLSASESGVSHPLRSGNVPYQCARATFTCNDGNWSHDNSVGSWSVGSNSSKRWQNPRDLPFCACDPTVVIPLPPEFCNVGCTGGPVLRERVMNCSAADCKFITRLAAGSIPCTACPTPPPPPPPPPCVGAGCPPPPPPPPCVGAGCPPPPPPPPCVGAGCPPPPPPGVGDPSCTRGSGPSCTG